MGVNQVSDVHKGSFLLTYRNKSTLHARQYPDYFPMIDIPHGSTGMETLNKYLLQQTLFDHGNTRFMLRNVNDYFFSHAELHPCPNFVLLRVVVLTVVPTADSRAQTHSAGMRFQPGANQRHYCNCRRASRRKWIPAPGFHMLQPYLQAHH